MMEFNSCIKIPNSKSDNKTLTIVQEIEEVRLLHDKLLNIAGTFLGQKNWNHTVTNQTVDYSEHINGKHLVGCITFVKVTFKSNSDNLVHEEWSYCLAEGPEKGLAINKARETSATNALKNALKSFGGEIAVEINKIECSLKKKPTSVSICTNKNNTAITNLSEPVSGDANFENSKSESTIKSKSKTPPKPVKSNTGEISEKNINQVIKEIGNKELQVDVTIPADLKPPSESKPKIYPKTPAIPKVEVTEFVENKQFNSDEEARQLRKRRQREKQEEYRKMFIEKQRLVKEG